MSMDIVDYLIKDLHTDVNNHIIPKGDLTNRLNIELDMHNCFTPVPLVTALRLQDIYDVLQFSRRLLDTGALIHGEQICVLSYLVENFIVDSNDPRFKLLMEYGANINNIGPDGKTPLMHCNSPNLHLLISLGADINICTPHGENILDVLCDNIQFISGLDCEETLELFERDERYVPIEEGQEDEDYILDLVDKGRKLLRMGCRMTNDNYTNLLEFYIQRLAPRLSII